MVVVFIDHFNDHVRVLCTLIYFIIRFRMYVRASMYNHIKLCLAIGSAICGAAGTAFVCAVFAYIHINNFILEMTLNPRTLLATAHTHTHKHFSISIQFNCFEQLMSVSLALSNRECDFI